MLYFSLCTFNAMLKFIGSFQIDFFAFLDRMILLFLLFNNVINFNLQIITSYDKLLQIIRSDHC
jgi:hypothetical protein